MKTEKELVFQDLCQEFTIKELKEAIFSFKNGTSPGPDGITIEFYKSMFSIIKHDLLALFNCIKDFEILPKEILLLYDIAG